MITSFCELSEFERPFHPKDNLIKSPHQREIQKEEKVGYLGRIDDPKI